jgi:hypothetical protein
LRVTIPKSAVWINWFALFDWFVAEPSLKNMIVCLEKDEDKTWLIPWASSGKPSKSNPNLRILDWDYLINDHVYNHTQHYITSLASKHSAVVARWWHCLSRLACEYIIADVMMRRSRSCGTYGCSHSCRYSSPEIDRNMRSQIWTRYHL